MANNRNLTQTTYKVSIPKEGIMEKIIENRDFLKKDDLTVIFLLMTKLEGWTPPESQSNKYGGGDDYKRDPRNFQAIDFDWAAQTLNIKKKDLKKSIKNLLSLDILEQGDDARILQDGYRFRI